MSDVQDMLRNALSSLDLAIPVCEIERRAHRRTNRRRMQVGSMVAGILAAVLIMQAARPAPSMASSLRRLADFAEDAQWAAPTAGQQWYSKSESFFEYGTGNWVGWETQVDEVWIAADGSGRAELMIEPGFTFFSEAQRQKWERSGGGMDGSMGELDTAEYGSGELAYSFGCCAITIADLLAMADDPAQFERLIREAAESAGPSPDQEAWTIFKDLAPAPLPPKMRATLYRVVADISPGTRYVGELVDPLGRPTIGFTRSAGSEQDVVMFDPSTGGYLGRQTVMTKAVPERGFEAGDIIDYNVIVESGWVDG